MKTTAMGLAALAAGLGIASTCGADTLAVRAQRLYVGDGRVVDNGVVLIQDGRIIGAGAGLAIPEGATVLAVPQGSITPGLIDANALLEAGDLVSRPSGRATAPAGEHALNFYDLFNDPDRHVGHDGGHAGVQCTCAGLAVCAFADLHEDLEPDQVCPVCGTPASLEALDLVSGVGSGRSVSESSSDVVPHTRIIDSVNLLSPDLKRLVAGGVTTVFVSPDTGSVIGARGAVIRTAGPLGGRVITAEGPVCAAIGSDPISVGLRATGPFGGSVTVRTRRPGTRMGVTWIFRKALHDADDYRRGLPSLGGADSPDEPALRVLTQVLDGKIPLRVHARQQNDILTALRMRKEFSIDFTLVEGTAAWKCIDELRDARTPVIYGPIYIDAPGLRGQTGETRDSRLDAFVELLRAGITAALTANDLREEDGLARQAMAAIRSGATTDQALQAVTITPAKLLGVSETLGTLEAGKRADLVVWTAEPFSSTSRPALVISGGRIALDAR